MDEYTYKQRRRRKFPVTTFQESDGEPLEGIEDMLDVLAKPAPLIDRTRRKISLQSEGTSVLIRSLVWLSIGVGILAISPMIYRLLKQNKPLSSRMPVSQQDTDVWYTLY